MKTESESWPGRSRKLAAALMALCAGGCAGGIPTAETGDAGSWSVTAWGERFEVFPEVDPLIAGESSVAHTHVTVLDGFAPLVEGRVEIVLRGAGGEQRFGAAAPVRPGIFAIELRPPAAGEYDLAFRIASPAGEEEIRGGRVRVGSAELPGGLLVGPAPESATDAGEPVPFLKEQQWRSEFATAWVRGGSLLRSVEGLARVRPPAGGEAAITAPVDAVLRFEPWPYPGQRVATGTALFRLVPRVASERSLPALEADAAALETELAAARARLGRLEELLGLEATSRREVEEARSRVEILDARRAAAGRDLQAARAAREGGSAEAVTLRSPFAGEIAAVTAAPGAAVAAGAPLARLVATDRVWLEVALAPEDARRLDGSAVGGVVLTFPEGLPVAFDQGVVRLVSVAPEVDPGHGKVAALVEVPAAEGLMLGTLADARILLAGEVEGIVVPTSALVDDGGVTVVYLQLSGESFARQPVRVVERQGERALVEGLIAGQRLVTAGGEAIRRASLMAGGEAHGHVH